MEREPIRWEVHVAVLVDRHDRDDQERRHEERDHRDRDRPPQHPHQSALLVRVSMSITTPTTTSERTVRKSAMAAANGTLALNEA